MYINPRSFEDMTSAGTAISPVQNVSPPTPCACAARLVDAPTKPAYRTPTLPAVLHADINHVRRSRDFGQVEAIVTITTQDHSHPHPRTERLLTSVACRRNGERNDLRARLIESAVKLSVLMHRAHRGGTLTSI